MLAAVAVVVVVVTENIDSHIYCTLLHLYVGEWGGELREADWKHE